MDNKSTSKLSPKTRTPRNSAGIKNRSSKTSVKSSKSASKGTTASSPTTSAATATATTPNVEPEGNTVYQFKVKDLDDNEVPMSRYAGQVILVVNLASNDRLLTNSNLAQLSRLHLNYEARGLRILAFPSNDFGSEPLETAKDIKEWKTKREINFDVMAKVLVNGTNASSLFAWLKQQKGGLFFIDAIKYNFTKFLVDRHGVPFARYSPLADFQSIETDIKALLI